MKATPVEIATIAAPIFNKLLSQAGVVAVDNVLEAIRDHARTAISQARMLVDEAESWAQRAGDDEAGRR